MQVGAIDGVDDLITAFEAAKTSVGALKEKADELIS